MDNDDKSGAYVKPPSGSYVLWENTMCNPLGDMRTQTQNAWHDGYASAKVEREWQKLTDEEIKSAWSQLWYDLGNGKFAASDDSARHTTIMFAKEIEAKLKEKNT